MELSTALSELLKDGTFETVITEAKASGYCSRPIRLRTPGTETKEHSGKVLVRCKSRLASICPACFSLYKGDAHRLIAEGMTDCRGSEMVFFTTTAPSFGQVHSLERCGTIAAPMRRTSICLHGVRNVCNKVHKTNDIELGQPLCGQCYDYSGAVLWNANAG